MRSKHKRLPSISSSAERSIAGKKDIARYLPASRSLK